MHAAKAAVTHYQNLVTATGLCSHCLHEGIKYGVQGSAMPAAGFDFNLDDNAIGDVINYIHGLNGLGGTPRSIEAAAAPKPAPATTTTTAKEGGEKSHER